MSTNGVHFQILTRVAKLPLVSSAIDLASDSYARLKSSNGLLNATLSRAEQSLMFVVSTAKPVIDKLEKPISMADNIACQGLDKLQEKVPAITKSAEEIRGDTKKLYEGSVVRFSEITRFGNDKVRGLKDYSVSRISLVLESAYVKAFLRSVDTAIDLTENAVDHYLPPAANEPVDETKGERTVVNRMGHLSDKMRRRMYEQVASKWLPFIFLTVNNVKATLLISTSYTPECVTQTIRLKEQYCKSRWDAVNTLIRC